MMSTPDQLLNVSVVPDIWVIIGSIIGVLGFIIACADLAYLIIRQKMKIEIEVKDYIKISNDNNEVTVIAYILITNRSFLPISIIRADIKSTEGMYCPAVLHDEADNLPVNLLPQTSCTYIFRYIFPIGTEPNFTEPGLDFYVYSSRGKEHRFRISKGKSVVLNSRRSVLKPVNQDNNCNDNT